MKKFKFFTFVLVALAVVLSSLAFSSLAANIYGRDVIEGGHDIDIDIFDYDFGNEYYVVYNSLVSTYYDLPDDDAGVNATVRTVLIGQTKPSDISADDFFQHAYASLVSTDGVYDKLDSTTLTSSGIVDSGVLECSTRLPMRTDHFAEVWDVENNELHDIWDIIRKAEDYWGIYSLDEAKGMSQYMVK